MEIGVDNCHIGKKLIIGKRIFYAALFIGNNGKGSNLGACTCRSRDSDEICLFAHFGECVNTLAYIHKAHCHIHKVCFGVLVKNPHNFARVHSAAAAESDYAVRSKSSHLLCAFFCACKRRVGSNVKECCVLNTQFIKFVGDGLCIAVVIKEAVGNYKRTFFAHNGFKLVKRNRQAAFFNIHLSRCSEPKHILSPFGNRFNVDKMLNADVFADAVSAPRTAAQGE